jgi:hypothetical protein
MSLDLFEAFLLKKVTNWTHIAVFAARQVQIVRLVSERFKATEPHCILETLICEHNVARTKLTRRLEK